MNVADNPLPDINPNSFPAKLWRLVNNPAYESICWDISGEFVMINQQLFERQILSPGTLSSNNTDAFKTTNFSSFIRQLNLYGFRKANSEDKIACQFFYNPNFKRNHPELVASLRRLTVDNKAKLQAGVDVSCRLSKRYQRQDEDDDDRDRNLKRRISSLLSRTCQQSTHQCHLDKTQVMKAHSETLVPQQYLVMGNGEGLDPIFSPSKEMPVSLSHHYKGVASTSSVMNAQQSLLAHVKHGNPNLTSFIPRNAQYRRGCCPPVFHCYHPDLALQQMGLLPTQSSYKAEYPVNMLEINQELQHKEKKEVKKCEINLDTIFQIADELMPVFPNIHLIKVETPDKSDPGLGPAYNNGEALLHKNNGITTTANPVCGVHVAAAVSGSPAVLPCKQLQKSVLSVPEQKPVDDIFEATTDRVKDDEIISVAVPDIVGDSSLD